jgi:hypothetical protein
MSADIESAPVLPVLTVLELDADPHGVFRYWRATHPVLHMKPAVAWCCAMPMSSASARTLACTGQKRISPHAGCHGRPAVRSVRPQRTWAAGCYRFVSRTFHATP